MKPLHLIFNPFPKLQTPRLHLRRINPDDSQRLFELRSNPEVMKYIDRPRASSIEDGRLLVNKIEEGLVMSTGITWGITLRTNTEFLIGTIGFWRIDVPNYRAEIGYMLDDNHQRKGLISEAMDTTINYAFDVMNLHSIEANTNPENLPSRRALEKAGFKQEAYFTENYFYNGNFLDSAIYSKVNLLHKNQ